MSLADGRQWHDQMSPRALTSADGGREAVAPGIDVDRLRAGGSMLLRGKEMTVQRESAEVGEKQEGARITVQKTNSECGRNQRERGGGDAMRADALGAGPG